MSLFWENASKLLDAALSAASAGKASESMTVLIGGEGGIHLIANNDWPLDRIATDRGAKMAYRVKHGDGRVSVDGQHGSTLCHLESEAPSKAVKELLRDQPRYLLE